MIRFLLAITYFFISAQLYANVVLYPLQGKTIPFSALSGQWVFINYWASWCGPCIKEIPELNRFYRYHKRSALFAVNNDGVSNTVLRQMVRHYGIRYPVLKVDPSHQLHLGDITGVPMTFVFNPAGKLVKTVYGCVTYKQLKQFMD